MNGLSMIFMVVVFGGMMFFMSRSQKKQQSQRQELLDSMKTGDEIVTIGGLHGVVSDFDQAKKTVLIDCEGIILEFDRAAIKTVKTSTIVAETKDEGQQPVEVIEEETVVVSDEQPETTSEDSETKN